MAYNNAEKLYFANWDVPKGGGTAAGGELRYQHMPSSPPRACMCSPRRPLPSLNRWRAALSTHALVLPDGDVGPEGWRVRDGGRDRHRRRRPVLSGEVRSPMRSTLRGAISEEIQSPRTLRQDSSMRSNLRGGGWCVGGGGSARVAGRSTIAGPRGKALTWHGRGVALLPLEAVDRKVMMMAPSPKGVLGEGGLIPEGVYSVRGAEARS